MVKEIQGYEGRVPTLGGTQTDEKWQGYSLSNHFNQFFSGTISGPHPPRTGPSNALVPILTQTC